MGLFKSTILKVGVQHKSHEIIFTNSWSLLPYKSEATLHVDGTEVAQSTKMTHLNPHEPIFSVKNVAPDLESIDVFLIGVLSIKASISVNGHVLHQDDIDVYDKIQARAFDS